MEKSEKTFSVGLVSSDKELKADVHNNLVESRIIDFYSIDQVKRDEYTILLVDFNILEDSDNAQFLLSKIRKKIHNIYVLLVLRVNHLDGISSDWFYDEFIVYPFRKYELGKRLEKLLLNNAALENTVSIGNLLVNLQEYTVYLNNVKLELTYKEFELLKLFAQNKGVVFSRKDLLNTIWGVEYIGGTRTVDVHIRRLRSKIGEEFNSIIETVRNVGYRCIETN